MYDFQVEGDDSVCILVPTTADAAAWVDEHISDEAMQWGNGVVIEHRYVQDVCLGILDDGLTITKDSKEMFVGQGAGLFLK